VKRIEVVVDVETTGFGQRDCIIELGAAVIQDGKVQPQVFSSLVYPRVAYQPYMENAFAVSGLTWYVLLGAPPWRDVWVQFLLWLVEGFAQPARFTAWNQSFDRRMLRQQEAEARQLQWRSECPMRECSQHFRGNRSGMKLSDALPLMGISHDKDKMHRAGEDARLAAEALLWLEGAESTGKE
jgi:DNA polymerase III epsilon subunit-like protein